MKLFARRRGPAPADLPPVPPTATRPSVPGVTTGAALGSLGTAFEPQPAPGPVLADVPRVVGSRLWRPGTYTVTYDRVGEHGRRGGDLPAPMPLTVHALTAGDLAREITEDVRQLTGLIVTTMVDLAVDGGLIFGDGAARLGSFTYQLRGRSA